MSCSTIDELEDQRRELESRRTMLEERFKLREATAQEFGVVHTRRLDRVLQAFVSQSDAARTRNQNVLEELRGYEISFDERVRENSWMSHKRLNLETERFLSVVEDLYPSWQERQLERKASQIRRLEQERCATEKRRRAARDRFVQEQEVNAVVEERQRLLDAARAQERIETALRHSQRESLLERARKQGNTATTPRQGDGSGREARRGAVVVVQKANPSDEGRSNNDLRELTGVGSDDSAGPDVQKKSARDDTAAWTGEKVDPEHTGVLEILSPDSRDASGSTGQARRTKVAAWNETGTKGVGLLSLAGNHGAAGGEACEDTNEFKPGTSAICLEQGNCQSPDDSGLLQPAVSMTRISAGSPPHTYPAPLVETRPVLAQIPSCPQVVDKGNMDSSSQPCPSIELPNETLSPLAGTSVQPDGKTQSESGATSVSTSESSSSSLTGTVPSSAKIRARSDEAPSSNPGDVESGSGGEDTRSATNEDGDAGSGSGGARRSGEREDRKSEEIAHGDLAALCPSILHASRAVVGLTSGIERAAQRMVIDGAGDGGRRSTSSVILNAYRTARDTSPSSRRAAIASSAAETSISPSIALSGPRRPLEEFDLGVLCGAVLDLVGSRSKDILPTELMTGPVTAATVRSQHCRRGPTERVHLFDGFISHIRHLGASGDVEPHAIAAAFESCFVVPDKRAKVDHGRLRGERQRLARKVTAILEMTADPEGPPLGRTRRPLEHAGCVSLQGLVGATGHVRRDRSVHERIEDTEVESVVDGIETENVELGTIYRAVRESPSQPLADESVPSGIGRDAATTPDVHQSLPAEDRVGAKRDEGGVSPIVQVHSSTVETPLEYTPGKTPNRVLETTCVGGENPRNALGPKTGSRTILWTGIERTMRGAADNAGGTSGARQAGQEQNKKSEPPGGSGFFIGSGGTIGKKKGALDLSVVAGLGVAASSRSKNLEEFEVDDSFVEFP